MDTVTVQGEAFVSPASIPAAILAIGVKGPMSWLANYDVNNDGLNITADALFYVKASAAPTIKLFNTM